MTAADKIIADGHAIADRLANASLSDLEKLEKDIDQYADYVDEQFGIVNEFGDKDCELSTFLYVALDWHKKGQVDPSAQTLAKDYLEDYVNFLDSKKWVTESYGQPLEKD